MRTLQPAKTVDSSASQAFLHGYVAGAGSSTGGQREWRAATLVAMNTAKAYFAILITFLVVDAVWIALVVRDFYDEQVGQLMRETPNAAAAGLFYLAYAAGILMLCVRPAFEVGSGVKAAVNGAVLGAIAYGTYTVTNYAIFEAWTLTLLVSDVAWGAFLTAVCAVAGYLATHRA